MIAWLVASRRGLLALLVPLLLGLFFTGIARAQQEPVPTVRVSATEVEVDEPFTIELKIMVDQGQPGPHGPELKPPGGLQIAGPQIGQQTFAQFGGGVQSVKTGISATWRLEASKPGRYTIPPPTVMWNGKRLKGTQVVVDVKPSSGRRRQQPQQSPFLMPGGGFQWPFGGGQIGIDDDSDAATASDLALMSAPDPTVFLRSTVDKTSVVVGEQVTLSFYVYRRGSMQAADWHEATLADFVRAPLHKDPGADRPQYAMAGGRRYLVQLFDRMAIFPMRAGDLHTGSMRVNFTGRYVGVPGQRESEDHVIHVKEPPRENRPQGYVLGDVGQFSLVAGVQPRRVDQGGAVAVTLKLSGTGNLPSALRVPERVGVEWLDPEKKESLEPTGNTVSGWRTFGYVVRLKNSGTVDLGEVALPYWDPAAKRYSVARAVLGTVEVNPTSPAPDPSAQKADAAAQKAEPFAALPSPRGALGAYTPPRPPLFAGRSAWLLIAAPPLLFGVFTAGAGATRRVRARSAASKSSPAALAGKALDDAAAAERAGDVKALTAALERAIHLAIEGATGLRSRGVLLADLPAELERLGVPRELGDRVEAALAACATIRFEPGGAASEAARDLGEETRELVDELAQHKAP